MPDFAYASIMEENIKILRKIVTRVFVFLNYFYYLCMLQQLIDISTWIIESVD